MGPCSSLEKPWVPRPREAKLQCEQSWRGPGNRGCAGGGGAGGSQRQHSRISFRAQASLGPVLFFVLWVCVCMCVWLESQCLCVCGLNITSLNPWPLQWKCRVLTPGLPGKSLGPSFLSVSRPRMSVPPCHSWPSISQFATHLCLPNPHPTKGPKPQLPTFLLSSSQTASSYQFGMGGKSTFFKITYTTDGWSLNLFQGICIS